MKARYLLPVLLLAGAEAGAQAFPEVGARAQGMGGAYVAVADGPSATWWNPAALALQRPAGSFVYGQTVSDAEGLAERLDDLAATRAMDRDILDRKPDALRALELLGAIGSEPDPVGGVRVLGAFVAGRNYGFSAYQMTLAQSAPIVDRSHVELSDDPATGLPFNDSRLALRSARINDYVLSLALDLGDPSLLLGGSVRWSHAETRLALPSLFAFPDFAASDVFDAASDGERARNRGWSFDLATLVTLHPKLRMGLVGKYLGGPEFELADSSKLRLDPRWRLGAALFPTPELTLSSDLDLGETRSWPGDPRERNLAVGGQVLLSRRRVALRGGLREPLSGPSSRLLTAGFGVRGGGWALDTALGYSPRAGSHTYSFELTYGR